MGLETAAIIGLGSLAVGATSTGLSIGQAAKQNKLKKEADAKATQAMADARKKLSVNYMDQLSIAKEPYRLAREAALSTGAQALEAGREGDERGAAATAGRVLAVSNQAQQKIGSAMEQELARLDALSAQEDADIAANLGALDLKTAQGAQLAARDAQQAKNAAITNAIKSGASTLTGALETFVPLYPQSKTSKDQLANQQLTQQLGMEKIPVSGGTQIAPVQSNQLATPQYFQQSYNYSELPAGPLQQMPAVAGPSINPFNFQSPQLMQLNQPTMQEMLDRNSYARAYQQGINF